MSKLLYLHVFEGAREILICCIKEHGLIRKDLVELDAFLAYHHQNYKVRGSYFEEGVAHICKDMKCVRGHIIDTNIV